MKTIILFISLTIISLGYTQENSTFDQLHGIGIESELYLSYDGTNFYYTTEKPSSSDTTPNKIEKGAVKNFQVSNSQENTFKIFLGFYNPLRAKISFTSSEIEDTNYTAITDFINNLPSDIPSIASSVAASTPAVYTSTIKKRKNGLEKINQKVNSIYSESAFMFDWITMFKTSLDKTKMLNVQGEVEPLFLNSLDRIINVVNGIENIEKHLFKGVSMRFNSKSETLSVNTWIKKSNEILATSDINNLDEFSSKLTLSVKVATKLLENQEQAESKLKSLKKLLTDDFIVINSLLDPNDLDVKNGVFKNLTQSKIVLIDAIVSEKLKEYALAIEKLTSLNKKLTDFTSQFSNPKYPKGYKLITENTFNWSFEKARQYDIEGINIKDDEPDEDSKNKVIFKVSKSQGRLALFVSAGLFYTPFEYKNYGISEEGLVAETQGDPVYFRPAAYLNFMFKPKRGDILYPLVQVGVSQGLKTPLFPIGAGFSIRNRFSVTAGPLLAFQNELDQLSVGATADDVALQDDIQSHIRVSWYISLNYKLGK